MTKKHLVSFGIVCNALWEYLHCRGVYGYGALLFWFLNFIQIIIFSAFALMLADGHWKGQLTSRVHVKYGRLLLKWCCMFL